MDLIKSKVFLSLSGMVSISSFVPSTLSISDIAYEIADCILTPRTSSLSRPISSTSSLSNCIIGYPLRFISIGTRSRRPISEIAIAQGCIERWRGRRSR